MCKTFLKLLISALSYSLMYSEEGFFEDIHWLICFLKDILVCTIPLSSVLQYGTVCCKIHTSAVHADQNSAVSSPPPPRYGIMSFVTCKCLRRLGKCSILTGICL